MGSIYVTRSSEVWTVLGCYSWNLYNHNNCESISLKFFYLICCISVIFTNFIFKNWISLFSPSSRRSLVDGRQAIVLYFNCFYKFYFLKTENLCFLQICNTPTFSTFLLFLEGRRLCTRKQISPLFRLSREGYIHICFGP